MDRIFVWGAGRVGRRVASLLADSDDAEIILVDFSEEALRRAPAHTSKRMVNALDKDAVDQTLRKGDIVVAAVPDSVCLRLAQSALRNGCHYLDFNENSKTAEAIALLKSNAESILIPSCGLSPGLTSALIERFTRDIAGPFDLDVYVGALPRTKINRLGYGHIVNIDGLIAEYTLPASIIRDGRPAVVPALSMPEQLIIDDTEFEAFTTGGTSNEMPANVAHRVRNYVFRTLRYAGHLDYLRFLLDDLHLSEWRSVLRGLLLNGLPKIDDDRIIVHMSARPVSNGPTATASTRTWNICAPADERSTDTSAVHHIAASHAAAVVDLLRAGEIRGRGLVRQVDISWTQMAASPRVAELFQ